MTVSTRRTPTIRTDARIGKALAAFEEYSTATFSVSWFGDVPKNDSRRKPNVHIHKRRRNSFCETYWNHVATNIMQASAATLRIPIR